MVSSQSVDSLRSNVVNMEDNRDTDRIHDEISQSICSSSSNVANINGKRDTKQVPSIKQTNVRQT